MRKTLFFTFIAASALAGAQKIPAEWTARYRAVMRRIEARDLKGWESGIAKGYVWTMPNGKVKSRAATIAEVKRMFAAPRIAGDVTVTSVRTLGDSARVGYDMRLRIGAGKGAGAYHEVGTDYWKRIGGRWMEVKTVSTVSEDTKG